MGKKRKHGTRGRGKPGGSGQAAGSARPLAEAVRRGRHGQTQRAVRLAQEAVRAAGSAEERLTARRVLAEAHLQSGLASTNATEALSQLNQALRSDPDSPRVAFYQALATLHLGVSERGLTALERSLDNEGVDLPGGTGYARQLAGLVEGRAGSRAGLSEVERVELGLVESLLVLGRGDGRGAAAAQLGLFPPETGGKGRPMEDTRVWHALLALASDGSAAPLQELRDAVEAAPPAARPRIRYYEAVALLRGGRLDEASALLVSLRAEGLDTPWLRHNLVALLRVAAQDLACAGRWEELVQLAGEDVLERTEDRILSETVALAHDHLAHTAAVSGQWGEAAHHWRRAEALHPRRQVAQNLALAEEALGEWEAAARAWRAMARRRPRKSDHPDFLTDDQVAALWRHAAECYERADAAADADGGFGRLDDVLTCVTTALRYAPAVVDLRLKRAELLFLKDSNDAAAQELDALLEDDPEHLEALRLRAAVEEDRPRGDPTPFLRRGLRLAPADLDLRESLALTYLRRTERPPGFFRSLAKVSTGRERLRLLEQGVAEVPDHPGLLAALGHAYREEGKPRKAIETLLTALDASARQRDHLGEVLHELLHAAEGFGEVVIEALPRVRGMGGLLPEFWIGQAGQVLECSLPVVWFDRFVEEALVLVGEGEVEDSRASVLYRAWAEADRAGREDLAGRIEARIREEERVSGAVELIEAERLMDRGELGQARRVLSEAARRARRAGDPGLEQLAAAHRMMASPARDFLRFVEGIIG